MNVTTAAFVGAASVPGRFPTASRPEVAFAGRSNVGKSSAINRLLGRRKLARTSRTPGRTQQLNFFSVDERLVFVDLPGYGYARVSKAARAAWRPLVESYLGGRAVLAGVVLLVDARRGLEDDELMLLDFLAARRLPVVVVATKIDKLSHAERERALASLRAAEVTVVPFSAVTGEGAAALWRVIAAWTASAPAAARPASPARARGPSR